MREKRVRQRAHNCAHNLTCGFTKLYREPEESLVGESLGGCVVSTLALSLPLRISGTRQRFLAGEPLLPGCVVFWAIFCFIQFQVRRSSWMLLSAGKWKLCVLPWRKLSASGRSSGLEPASRENEEIIRQAVGLVCFIVSIPVTGRVSKALPGLLP